MAEPFIGEIRMMSFSYAPQGWAQCNGQFLPINQNQALFSLLGTTFGGNGQTTFALPDLRSRTPIHVGNGYVLGQNGGEQNHTLTVNEIPGHAHQLIGSNTPVGSNVPTGAMLAIKANTYTTPQNLVAMAPASLSNAGGSQPHQNMQPYLVINFCIALQGIFPSQ